MLPLTGYTDRLSATPGGKIAFKISSTFSEPYAVDVVRIIHGDPNPNGPGVKLRTVETSIAGSYPSRSQPVHLGSYVIADDTPALHGLGSFNVTATIWPTLPDKGPQAVISKWDQEAGAGFALEIGPEGASFTVGSGSGGEAKVSVGKRMRRHKWYRVHASHEPATGAITVSQEPLKPEHGLDDTGTATHMLSETATIDTKTPLLIAARSGRELHHHFNGKIEDPLIAATVDHDAMKAFPAVAAPHTILVAMNFGRDFSNTRVHAVGKAAPLAASVVNLPARAVTGSNWDGTEMSFKHAPDQYRAIHFHDDDLHDCGWEDDFVFEIPQGMPSGIYGCRIKCQHAEDMIPFYVRPLKGKPTSDAVFLASTFTYQVYANHKRDVSDHKFRERGKRWGAAQYLPDDHSDYAHSTYNLHHDGSGVGYSSRLRPIMTMRHNFLTFDDPYGSGLRHFPADTHLIDWLDAMGHGVDIITDEDLDDEGAELIAPYKVLLTGSHPEYHTKGTLDALMEYTHQRGGRLMYMGGNGFYWRVARSDDWPGALEIRRAEGGIRAWAAEPGEYYNAFDAQYGGLWRRNGRAPQQLAGVGFSSQGAFEGSYFRRTEGGDDPQASWILEGINEGVLGNFGLSGGGAAGFELDRADIRLGTPETAVVIAASENHQTSFIAVLEDQLSQRNTVTGVPHNKLIRADITYFETPNGGAVFSVGSITFCGSLSHQGYKNSISRMINNVLERFRE
ncbi:MAG: N,N-dimethylformamidase large subunit [Alphaproteobacteria bacterium]|nr:N,N-dimethylformamidase large subunit [Alphaproteobacteria bacterium]